MRLKTPRGIKEQLIRPTCLSKGGLVVPSDGEQEEWISLFTEQAPILHVNSFHHFNLLNKLNLILASAKSTLQRHGHWFAHPHEYFFLNNILFILCSNKCLYFSMSREGGEWSLFHWRAGSDSGGEKLRHFNAHFAFVYLYALHFLSKCVAIVFFFFSDFIQLWNGK